MNNMTWSSETPKRTPQLNLAAADSSPWDGNLKSEVIINIYKLYDYIKHNIYN